VSRSPRKQKKSKKEEEQERKGVVLLNVFEKGTTL